MKDDLSQKNTWKYDIFFKRPEEMVFSKQIVLEYDLSCIIWKDGGFFSEKMIVFLWTENEKWSSSRLSSPEKIHLKVIDILDRILETVPKILCTFMETFLGVFIYCFPVEKKKQKKQET